jgi:peptide/nickel transport system permease protein
MRESAGLRRGLLGLGALVGAVAIGSALWPIDPDAPLDPPVAGLAPPGSRFAVIHLADGRDLAARSARIEGEKVLLERELEPRQLDRSQLAGSEALSSRRFLLGSDRFGRDVAARLLAGGRTSLAAAALALAVILLVGVPAGLLSGLAPPALDLPMLRLFEALQAFPRLFLLLALAAIVRPGFVAVALLLGLTGWVPMARLVRAEVRTLRRRDFVLAARVVGAGPWRIAFRHILPNAAAPIAVEASLAAAAAILSEAALSFLGFGLQPPAASWGNMIADGRETIAAGWWVALFPGLAIACAAIVLNQVGEGARDALDPRGHRSARADDEPRAAAPAAL